MPDLAPTPILGVVALALLLAACGPASATIGGIPSPDDDDTTTGDDDDATTDDDDATLAGDSDGDGHAAIDAGGDDCDDTDSSVHPGAVELCDGIDNDCNGASDEPFDDDGDGWGWCAGDCNDAESTVYPDAPELCDHLDNDCDTELDEGFDADEDGFATCWGDCDDDDPDSHPWAEEPCDGIDNDCSGVVDDPSDGDGDGFTSCSDTPDCDDTDETAFPGNPELCDGIDNDCLDGPEPDEVDADADGVLICAGDCDDTDPFRAEGLLEICDGQDNDCDDETLETLDDDGDGWSPCDGDCDDTRPGSSPDGVEVCDGLDNDCNGALDDGGVCGACTVLTAEGSTYWFCTAPLVWEAAHSACLDLGVDLVAVNDADENQWIADTAITVAAGTFWGGLNDLEEEGVWAWSNGDPVTFVSWSAGEPNNAGDEDCTELLWNFTAWNDNQCSQARQYVCESLTGP